ncbi:MAG TPA: hypothetical protein VGQ36_04440 [Thermoanaerobaculia bacterium]|jgi:hypothetical protein|nr:hypothetical protein [Thermoanaerobaculia bacterium]
MTSLDRSTYGRFPWADLVLATSAGLLVAFLAFLLAGGGHGWTAAGFSIFAVVLAPAGVIASTSRQMERRRALIAIVAINIALDLMVLVLTLAHESRHFAQAYEEPVVMFIWAALWLGLQSIPAVSLWRGSRAG